MEAHDVEGRQGGSALEREQRNAGAPHLIRHVDPGDVAALAGDTLLLVQNVIEDGDTLIGKTDLIGIGIDEAGSILRIGRRKGSPLVVDISAGLLDPGEQRLKIMKTILVGYSHETLLYSLLTVATGLSVAGAKSSSTRRSPSKRRSTMWLIGP